MKTFIIALAASTAIAGAAYAQQGSPTTTDTEQDATTLSTDETTAPAQAGEGTAVETETAVEAGTAAEVEVGGAPMFADQPISVNAPTASNLTTLWAAVQAAGLEETLAGEGPFTVFAPDNAAFDALPAGTVDTLLEPENRDQLTSILTYHVVPSVLTSADLADGSSQEVTTVEGGTLTIASSGGTVTVTDEEGNTATVTQADVLQSNGVVHVIDTVLMPAE